MHAYRTSSMRDHLLARYRNAFAAIVLAQLRNQGFKDGMQVGGCRLTHNNVLKGYLQYHQRTQRTVVFLLLLQPVCCALWTLQLSSSS